ncbi:MAG: EF-hand domain-containing protein [Candidatus Tectomicrobia bacterium]|nr:EF-hand domain-containing protein [Candidatus Tectomicrobia bacterium]
MRWVGIVMTALSIGFMMFDTPGHLAAAETPSAYDLSDKNGDGRIDREEYHRRMTDVFFMTDTDKDSHLTMHELSDVSETGFKAADRNHDGKLSLSEYINARFKTFYAADHDQDGMLSREEAKNQ